MDNEQRIIILKNKRDVLNSISPSFCTAKWLQTTLYLQNGYNHSCHHPAPHKIPVEEVVADPAALHNSQYKKEQRRLMLEGVRPEECSYCWNIEDLGSNRFSDRHYKSADYWAWDRVEEVAKSNYQDNINPSYLEVSFSNVCNFKCSYCSSEISSKWLEEINQHGQYPTKQGNHHLGWLKETGRYPYKHSDDNPYIDAFWKWFPDVLPSLKVFRITGGEPLLSKDTWRVLDYIIAHRSTPIEIALNSNLCVEDVFIDKLISKINELKQLGHDVKIFTSIESTGIKAEYSRYGMDYTLWCNNLDKLISKTDVVVGIMTTVNILSISDFNKFVDLIMEFRAKFNTDMEYNRIPMTINLMKWPPYLNVSNLPKELKEKFSKEILEHCKQWLKYYKKDLYARVYLEEWDQINRMCEYLASSTPDEEARIDFVKFIREYDKRRDTNFETVFPEYKEMIKEWENA